MRLWMIRHGESTWNASNRWQGQSDVPLSPRGRLQVRALAARLFGGNFARAVSSDLSRAMDTAAGLAMIVEPDPRFREIDVGEWAGLKRSEVGEKFPEQVAALRAGKPVRIGGGESMEEFEARVDAAIDDLVSQHASGDEVLLATHGGVIRALTTRLLNLRNRQSPLTGVGNTSISVMADGRLIESYNDALHLDAGDQDSAIARMMSPATRVAFVAAELGGEPDRRTVDLLLSGLGIPLFFVVGEAQTTYLAQELMADPTEASVERIRALAVESDGGSFGIVATPEEVVRLVTELLDGAPDAIGALSEMEHGAVAQLRLWETRAELYSYGVTLAAHD